MSVARHHAEWLSLVEVSGPFLSMPVLLGIFPDGLDRFADERDRRSRLHVGNEEWLDSQTGTAGDPSIHRAWVRHVLREVLEYEDELLLEGQSVPPSLSVTLAEHGERLAPDYVLCDPEGRPSAGKPRVLINVVPKSQGLDAALQGHRWKASPATRMMTLLHGTQGAVRIGLVTNGEHWMLVHAKPGETTSFVSFYASLWLEEPLTLQALHSLVGARRLFGVGDAETLEALFAKSSENQQEVTDQLGAQVRRAVEVLIQTIDRIDRDRGRTLLRGIDEQQLYESAVTVMMRLVFLFAAEERKLLLLGDPLYDQYYAVSTLREQLQTVADAHGEEVLQRRYDAWSRLLATFRAMHGGVQHESMRLPAYGGSLFDPDRFPFLEGRAPGTKYIDTPAQPLPIDSLTVLDLLNSLQLLQVKVPGGGPAETRRLSFRALGVEQIGHVYEGLLDHTAKRAKGPVVSLRGSKNLEPEIELEELERRREQGQQEQLVSYLAEETGRSASAIQRGFLYKIDDHAARHFLTACDNDGALYGRVAGWAGLIREDSHGHPVIFPAGSVYVTEGTARRSTGTHYTPRSLTEPIVQYALEPLVYEGPAEGWLREKWKLRTAKELLALRVCDLAMGSGAFLVQACRYLAERTVETWEAAETEAGGQLVITPEGELSKADPSERKLAGNTEERLAIARRYVADRCLYGVDINPMAVEMAKLSLWLVTLQKDRPFTFVDHALKCGDSLLGVTKFEQIENFTLRGGPVQGLFARAGLRDVVKNAAKKRSELEALPSDHYDQIEQKRKLHAEAETAIGMVRAIANLLISLELRAEDRTYEADRGAEGERIRALVEEHNRGFIERLASQRLGRRRPFHWAIEFPEVMNRGGFHCCVGNPPFKGGAAMATLFGEDWRNFVVRHIGRGVRGARGQYDLSAFFLLRCAELLQVGGCMGIIATNSIAQGDSKQVGLSQLCASGYQISRAVSSAPWPGAAAVQVSTVWMTRGDWNGERILDQLSVQSITDGLGEAGQVTGEAHPLVARRGKAFRGAMPYGEGFFLSREEAESLISGNPKNRDVIRLYLRGEDLTTQPDQKPTRYVIDFRDWSEEKCSREYPDCFSLVEARVKPQRLALPDNNSTARQRRRYWWRFSNDARELYRALAGLARSFAISRVTAHHVIAAAQTDIVLSERLVVFAFEKFAAFALLSSAIHEVWAYRPGTTTHETRNTYFTAEAFETFCFPKQMESLERIGTQFYEIRSASMKSRSEGLTVTYNRFHSPNEESADIDELRKVHVRMDHAVAAAYGWDDLDLGHSFYETKHGIRYTISEPARRIVLDRLMSLNHECYAAEVLAGLHEKGKAKAVSARAKLKHAAEQQPLSAQLGFAALDAPTVAAQPAVACATKAPALDDYATALLDILNTAYLPLGKSALIEMAKIPESAWSAAIQSLKSQGLVEQHGEKRSTTYARKRS